MVGQSILLFLALIAQDKPKAEADAEKAKRAAIVDEVMNRKAAQPAARPAPAVAPAPAVVDMIEAAPPPPPALVPEAAAVPAAPAVKRAVVQRAVVQRRTQRRVTLEPKAVPRPAPAEDDEDAPARVQQMMGFNVTDMAIARETFDQWIFTAQLNEESRKIRLETLLEQKVTTAMDEQKLDGTQLKKLRLAGSGDIKRFFDRVEAARAEFEAVRQDYTKGLQVLNNLEPLPTEYQVGPFGSDSFFAKTLERMESHKQ